MEGFMPGTSQTVTVIETEKGFRVRPASVVAANGDMLKFRNLTGLTGFLVVPPWSFLGSGGSMVPLTESGPDLVVDTGTGKGTFPYQVYLLSSVENPFARRIIVEGESAPHVIVG